MNTKQQEIIGQFKAKYRQKFNIYKMRVTVDTVTSIIAEEVNSYHKFKFWDDLIPAPLIKPLNELYFELKNVRN
jgi:hypothetical protein